ncbi:hypothetical protein FUA23_17265 [Neolewinella aurantiaca]|uniref:Alginate export domain-containing protein n=1 Tax=Neolewinella aurantiaca TaxID=2602767 RepID=A0A5C7FPG9_9BACT|nr:alginate export family protein [Neolewinella aurantiaca]TXF87808.1 hypothetical protein FUA23_17265 [Neolewinella aurantiaca]
MKTTLFALLFLMCTVSFAQKTDSLKLDFQGELRARYEHSNGQFRAGKSGSDQLLLFRTLLHFRYGSKKVKVGLELQDSRTYLGDGNSPVSSSFTNVADILQGYVEVKTKPLLRKEGEATLKLGRQTVSVGSKRQIERVSYANVIKAYTGGHYLEQNHKKDELHVFYVVPIDRLPKEKSQVLGNEFMWDREMWNQHIWAVHYRNHRPFTDRGPKWAEAFVYGFDEQDTFRKSSSNRFYVTTGLRLQEPIKENRFNYDVEFAYRCGSRQAENDFIDGAPLAVSAHMLLFRAGYTFSLPLKVNVAFQHYVASGDKDPSGDEFQQFERLFGGRRTDLNNTSIHGPLTPSNLSATGLRVELLPEARWDARVHYSYANLASATDAFIIGKYQDTSGASGRFLGHTLDSRVRFWNQKKTWTLDFGASLFILGSYTRAVRVNENETRNIAHGYLQVIKKI